MSETARRLSTVKHSFALVVVALGCRGGSQSAVATKAECSQQLGELQKFYEAVAADNAMPAFRERIETAPVHLRELPSIGSGAPVDVTQATLLVVGPDDTSHIGGEGSATVLFIDAATPWSRIADTLQGLVRDDVKNVSVAYTVKGAFARRTPPKLAGSDGQIDLPTIGDAIAKTTAGHCPAYAKQLATTETGNIAISDPAFLRGLAAMLPTCDCDVDLHLLEVMPWLVARPLVTTVPLAASAPSHEPAQTWGDLVAAAKGPVPLALPELPPPPPPPPPPHRR